MIKGKPVEKLFWAISMILIMVIVSYMVYMNAARYLAFDVRTEVRNEDEAERRLPVITLCVIPAHDENLFCYNNQSIFSDDECSNGEGTDETQMLYQEKYEGKWLSGKNMGRGCHVFNEEGNTTISRKEYQQIIVNSPSSNGSLVVIFHSPEEYANTKALLYITRWTLYMSLSEGAYKVELSEKKISRLAAPYQSNCVDGNLVSNLFSDRYTCASCKESCAYKIMRNQCDEVLDLWKNQDTYNGKKTNNENIEHRKNCIRKYILEAMLKEDVNCVCENECEETTYTAISHITTKSIASADWQILFYHKDVVHRVKHVPDYPLEEFLGAFGGVIGLGTRVMTSLQLLVFLCLCVGHFFKRNV